MYIFLAEKFFFSLVSKICFHRLIRSSCDLGNSARISEEGESD